MREQGLGVVIRWARAIRPAVEQLLARIESYRANVRRLHNVAVFEVVDIMESLLRSGGEIGCEVARDQPQEPAPREAASRRRAGP